MKHTIKEIEKLIVFRKQSNLPLDNKIDIEIISDLLEEVNRLKIEVEIVIELRNLLLEENKRLREALEEIKKWYSDEPISAGLASKALEGK